ncbi:unnamed protein product [Porites lobata]|uniref:Uncharacterized protein n=1 Tax=Porites lobata TaxID=104759 RepID=A0ABN8MZA9_9CNID|nr:unnamed protein product [Porites lobata]
MAKTKSSTFHCCVALVLFTLSLVSLAMVIEVKDEQSPSAAGAEAAEWLESAEEEANKRAIFRGKHGRNKGGKGNGGKGNGNGGKKGTGSECKPGRSNPGDRGEIYMVTMSGSFKLNCHVSYNVCVKDEAEHAAHGAISNSSIDMGGGTEWFYYGTSANLELMRQAVRAAINPWIERAGGSSDFVESSINPCLAPNQAGAIMPTNYGNFNPRFASVYNTKWRQTLQGNVLQIKYNCK